MVALVCMAACVEMIFEAQLAYVFLYSPWRRCTFFAYGYVWIM